MTCPEKKYLVIGAGGHSRAVIDCLNSSGKQIEGILDLDFRGQSESIMDVPVLGYYEMLFKDYDPDGVEVALAFGDNKVRTELYISIKKNGYSTPAIIHGTAIVSDAAVLNDGCFVGAGAIINGLAFIGRNSIINTGSIIEHETSIGSNCHIGPGSRIAGRVKVGDQSFVGIGSTIIDKIIIGNRVVVGAGSVVLEDVESGRTVAGVPARIVR